VLLIGAGGVGSAIATAANDAAGLDHVVVTDVERGRAEQSIASLDERRFVARALDTSDTAAVVEGCATVQWRGRMQWVPGRPSVLVDAAHNPAGMAAMVDAVAGLGSWPSVAAVFAAMSDKDARGMFRALLPHKSPRRSRWRRSGTEQSPLRSKSPVFRLSPRTTVRTYPISRG